MSRDDLHFRLRIPEDLKARIEASAATKRRSMTAEIVARLEESLDLEASLSKRDADELDFGETPKQIYERKEAEIAVDRYLMEKILRNQRFVGKVLANRLVERDPVSAKLVERYFSDDPDNADVGE